MPARRRLFGRLLWGRTMSRGLRAVSASLLRNPGATSARLSRRFRVRFADHALPPARTVLHVRVVRRAARAIDLARRVGGQCPLEFLAVAVRQNLMRQTVRALVIRPREIDVS